MRSKTTLLAAAFVVIAFTVAASAAPENIAFILDASNSMNKPFDVGSRLEVAQDALIQLLDVVEAYSTAGLYVYGHRIPKSDVDASCQDIEALYPVLPEDASTNVTVSDAILSVRAQGMTPISDALITVANDLTGYGGESIIILITDGEETCGGDPYMVAEMLRTLDPPVILHIVGLDVEAGVRDALTEIAGITGGSYYGVGAAGDLFAALYSAVATDEVVEQVDVLDLFACYGVTNVIYGTEDDDVLYGTAGNDLIFGYGGNDFLIGLDGNDVLCGGPGNDIIEGGNGIDILDGGEGNDLMFGGPDDDLLCGGPGEDSIEGDGGNDALDGGPGMDKLLGGRGNDVLYCADGLDIMMEGTIVAGSAPVCPVCDAPCGPICPQPDPCQKPAPAPCGQPEPACPQPEPACPQPEPACPQPEPVRDCPPGDPKTLNEGETIQLHGTVSDKDCNVVEILWQVAAGTLSDPTSLHPTYTAPMIDGCEDIDVLVSLSAVDSCGARGDDSFILHIRNVNHPPVADAGPDQCIDEGSVITLGATASDADCETLKVEWTILEGRGVIEDPTVLNAVYVAPYTDLCLGERAVLQLRVIDPCGAVACDTVTISIMDVNTAPTVDLGPAFSVEEGVMIRLTPVVNDAEGDVLSYSWSTTGGSIDDACAAAPTLCVPMTALCEGEDIVVSLTVTDPCGLSATDQVCIHIENVNTAPTVDLGPDLCMAENGVVTLTPAVYDAEGDALAYEWAVTGGSLDSLCAATVVYCAPPTDVCEGETFVIQVTVTDPCGLSATDTIMVKVENVNQAPIVHADP